MLSCLVDSRFSIKISHGGYSQMLDALTGEVDPKLINVNHEQVEDIKHYGMMMQEIIGQSTSENSAINNGS